MLFLTCQAFRALSFGQNKQTSLAMGCGSTVLRHIRTCFLRPDGRCILGLLEALRFKVIDGMLDLGIMGTLPSLGHHLPIGLFENLSLLLPSKDNPFLTLTSKCAHHRAPVRHENSGISGRNRSERLQLTSSGRSALRARQFLRYHLRCSWPW